MTGHSLCFLVIILFLLFRSPLTTASEKDLADLATPKGIALTCNSELTIRNVKSGSNSDQIAGMKFDIKMHLHSRVSDVRLTQQERRIKLKVVEKRYGNEFSSTGLGLDSNVKPVVICGVTGAGVFSRLGQKAMHSSTLHWMLVQHIDFRGKLPVCTETKLYHSNKRHPKWRNSSSVSAHWELSEELHLGAVGQSQTTPLPSIIDLPGDAWIVPDTVPEPPYQISLSAPMIWINPNEALRMFYRTRTLKSGSYCEGYFTTIFDSKPQRHINTSDLLEGCLYDHSGRLQQVGISLDRNYAVTLVFTRGK